MERQRAGPPLHDRIVSAIERAARVQGESCALVEHHLALAGEIRKTLALIDHRRIEEGDPARTADPAFGNGQRDAEGRSPAG